MRLTRGARDGAFLVDGRMLTKHVRPSQLLRSTQIGPDAKQKPSNLETEADPPSFRVRITND